MGYTTVNVFFILQIMPSNLKSPSGEVVEVKTYEGRPHYGKKRFGRGAVESGLTHECGVFGAIGIGEWPSQLEISQIVTLGLVALQHR